MNISKVLFSEKSKKQIWRENWMNSTMPSPWAKRKKQTIVKIDKWLGEENENRK